MTSELSRRIKLASWGEHGEQKLSFIKAYAGFFKVGFVQLGVGVLYE